MAKSLLVKYDCGCIGTPPYMVRGSNEHPTAILFKACDGDMQTPRLGMFYREMANPFTPLDYLNEKEFIHTVDRALRDADAYDDIRRLLRITDGVTEEKARDIAYETANEVKCEAESEMRDIAREEAEDVVENFDLSDAVSSALDGMQVTAKIYL